MEKKKIPIEIEYYDADTKIWCEFRQIHSYIGAIENKKFTYSLDELPDIVYGRYLYENNKNNSLWFYGKVKKTALRVKNNHK